MILLCIVCSFNSSFNKMDCRKIGRRRGMILDNTFNCLYLITVINSTNLISLICAELMSSFSFSLKDIAEPAILNESIEFEKEEI